MKRGCVMLGFLIDCDCDVIVIVIVSFPLVSSVPPPEQPLLLCTVSFPCCGGEGLNSALCAPSETGGKNRRTGAGTPQLDLPCVLIDTSQNQK